MSLSLWGVLYLSNKAVDRIREIVAAQLRQAGEEEELGLRKLYETGVREEGEGDRDESISQDDSGVIIDR